MICPRCTKSTPAFSTRCPHCTSEHGILTLWLLNLLYPLAFIATLWVFWLFFTWIF
jgi:hypothetical protein